MAGDGKTQWHFRPWMYPVIAVAAKARGAGTWGYLVGGKRRDDERYY